MLIPMIGGSLIGQAVVKTSGETFLEEASGQMQYVPNGNLFIVGAAVIALSLIPIIMTIKYHKARAKQEAAETTAA